MIIKDGAKMSKSKGNVVSPDELIKKYGADTVRLYTLFIGPPEKDAEWNDRAVGGAWRFLNRVWRLVNQKTEDRGQKTEGPVNSLCSYGASRKQKTGEQLYGDLRRKTHLTIKKVTEDIENNFQFNTAIANIMELVNLAQSSKLKAQSSVLSEAIETAVILLAPFVPHIAEEMWNRLGHKESIFTFKWPEYNPALLEAQEIQMVIQINGKVRSSIIVNADIKDDELKQRVLTDEKIKNWIKNKEIRRFIIVPNKLINVVV